MTSCVKITLSEILWPAMKPACSCEMKFEKITLNLFATTFITNLYNTEQTLMGLNWLKSFGLSFFGISTIKVLFSSSSILLPVKIPWTHSHIAPRTISHWLWKKCAWKPSLPRGLRGAMSKRAFLISLFEPDLPKKKISWSLSQGNILVGRPFNGVGISP